MRLISLRLPDEIQSSLERESARVQRPKSELARDAIAEYLERRERQRFEADLARAARARSNTEALAVAAEALPLDNESLDLADGLAVAEPRRHYDASRRGSTRARKKR
ncbi:MAG: ribbon-helix-helix protein, CopG family [Gammaproteobacteria bacterium]|nr:ribbon-helix-helix protein, CopG family [Gammaproteobacteria bacterium]